MIQRFGSALNLNLHYRILYLDSVYSSKAVTHPIEPSTAQDLDKVTQKIAERVSRYLERAGYQIRDAESEYLDLYPDEEDVMAGIVGRRPRLPMAVLIKE